MTIPTFHAGGAQCGVPEPLPYGHAVIQPPDSRINCEACKRAISEAADAQDRQGAYLRNLAYSVVVLFPGYEVAGWGPDIHLSCVEDTRFGARNVDNVQLSVHAALTLVTGAKQCSDALAQAYMDRMRTEP